MLRIRLLIACCLLSAPHCISQPKLVVGIVVDQMRFDYIDKYWSKFGEGGFKRLVKEGYNCRNTNYNYVPTFTAPGHASIYTGATPSVHGIVSNEWVNKSTLKKIYCVYDSSRTSVGGKGLGGQMSPVNLISSTVGEELRKKYNQESKVIGIALKDRGAILPAGHGANAAYWFDGSTGNWITSTYYMNELPAWVTEFNKKELVKKYLLQTWTPLLPDPEYTLRDIRDTACETAFKGKQRAMFPYVLPELMKLNGELGLIRSTPFGNSFTRDFAIETIRNEKMGKGAVPDMLCVSFSSTDYIGHQFGPQSVEVEDCYLRLDEIISELLTFLDEWVGKNNVLVFLTADHGAAESINCGTDKSKPRGLLQEKAIADSVKRWLLTGFKDSIPLVVNDFDVYLDSARIVRMKHGFGDVRSEAMLCLQAMNGIEDAFFAGYMRSIETPSHKMVKAGFYAGRSGDVTFILKPNWLQDFPKGTSHGSPYEYDTHVPLVWWGYKVVPGSSEEALAITQIAPTLSALLKIPVPADCNARAIVSLIK